MTSSDSAGFIPATGSSSSRIFGSAASARAISRRRRLAYDSEPAGCSCRGPENRPGKKARISRAFAVASRSSRATHGMRNIAPKSRVFVRLCMPTSRFSSTVMLEKRRNIWNVRETPFAWIWSGRSPAMLSLSSRTSPESGS